MTTAMYELVILDFGGVCVVADGTRDLAASDLVEDARNDGIVVAVLSNELDDRTVTDEPVLQAVDHVVACNTGIQKPDRRAFQRVLLLTGAAAEHTLVVDDSTDNVRGAEAAGITALRFDTGDRARSWAAVRGALGLV